MAPTLPEEARTEAAAALAHASLAAEELKKKLSYR
jgi:hypothetical protein